MRGKPQNYEAIPSGLHGPLYYTCVRCGVMVHTTATYRHDMWHDGKHDGDVREVRTLP